jgi:hypothetical protein
MFRLQRYKETEQQANKRFDENCRMRTIPNEAGGVA